MSKIEILAQYGELRKVAMNEIIFNEGEEGHEMFFILSGEVNIISNHAGIINLLAQVKPGDVFGEMTLLDKQPRSATAIAASDGLLFVINDSNFETIFYMIPEISLSIAKRLSYQLREKNREVNELLKERYIT